MIRLVDGSFRDGVIYCKVDRIAVGTVVDQEFDLHNQQYHVLVAIGRGFTGILAYYYLIISLYLRNGFCFSHKYSNA